MAKTKLCYNLFLLLLVAGHATVGTTVKFLPGFQGPLPFELETGYVGVGDSEDVQLFYYFIKSESNPESDPLMLWITGGPGCSALSGLVYEIGPITFEPVEYNGSLPTMILNPYSWTKTASIIFLDFPVGTGFSYATTPSALQSSDLQASEHVYQFLHKWFVDHPEFLRNPFYVGGDSYSGMVVPIITQIIGIKNEMETKPFINLKGYLLGNPSTFKGEDNYKILFAYGMGLISDELYETDWYKLSYHWADDGQVRDALSIRKGTIGKWDRCATLQYQKTVINSIPYHENLSSKGYSGDHDMGVTFQSTQAWIKSLNYSVLDDWRTWTVDNQVAGEQGILHQSISLVNVWPCSKGESSVAESLKKTLDLLEHSGSKYSGAKSDGRSTNESSPLTPHKLSTSKINLRDNPCYSPTSSVIMQAMVTDASSMEEQLANLTKAIEGLTNYVWNQEARIDKIVDRVEGLIDGESIHALGKAPEVHEIENSVKQTLPTKEVQVSTEEMIPIGQLREFIEENPKDKYDVVTKYFLVYAKPYTAKIDNLKMPVDYQPPKFQQFEGKGNPKQHVTHFVETCNNDGTYGDYLVKQFVRSLNRNTFDWYTNLEPNSIDSWEQLEHELLNQFYSTRYTVSMIELTNTRQRKYKSVIDFIKRWINASLNCKHRLSEAFAIEMCVQGMHWELL
ncbi:putative serine carboxypeptidase-like 19-like [Capsicum annuum]|nr:putative serine carboxypeptidase-like 19-like [Capsicum annuum]